MKRVSTFCNLPQSVPVPQPLYSWQLVDPGLPVPLPFVSLSLPEVEPMATRDIPKKAANLSKIVSSQSHEDVSQDKIKPNNLMIDVNTPVMTVSRSPSPRKARAGNVLGGLLSPSSQCISQPSSPRTPILGGYDIDWQGLGELLPTVEESEKKPKKEAQPAINNSKEPTIKTSSPLKVSKPYYPAAKQITPSSGPSKRHFKKQLPTEHKNWKRPEDLTKAANRRVCMFTLPISLVVPFNQREDFDQLYNNPSNQESSDILKSIMYKNPASLQPSLWQ